jgi:hypothetical protein
MTRKQAKYPGPFFFGLVAFFFYMVIYRPSPGSEDFITALMGFCAALAWCAVITLAQEKKPWALYLYVGIAMIFPLFMPLFFKEFNILWHMVTLGIIVLAVIGLRLFVPGYLKYKKEK